MRAIKKVLFAILILISGAIPAYAIIGPSTALQSVAILGGVAKEETFHILDPDTGYSLTMTEGNYITRGSGIQSDSLLSWAPYTLENPTIITIEESPTTADYIRVTKNQYPYTSPAVTETANTTTTTIALTSSEDAEIYLPCDSIVDAARILITRGRKINIIGGHLRATSPADATIRGLLRLAGQQYGAYIEGIVLDANNQVGLDAFEYGNSSGLSPFKSATYTMQNSVIKNVGGAALYHSDCFQAYGGARSIRIDNVKCRSQYQGFFMDPQYPVLAYDMRRIDTDYTDPTADETETGYTFYLHAGAPDDLLLQLRPAINLSLVYAGRRETSYGVANDGYWGEYSIYPKSSLAYGFDLDIADPNSTYATLSASFPEVVGRVTRGNPPTAFIDENDIGLNYTPPGYRGQ